MKSLNLGISLLLEIAMLGGLCYWGFAVSETLWLGLVLGIGVPIVVIAFWSLYLAPNGKRCLKLGTGSVMSLLLFILTAVLVGSQNHILLAVIMAAVSVTNFVLKLAWKQW